MPFAFTFAIGLVAGSASVDCGFVTSHDQRVYCVAVAERKPYMCSAISDSSLRALCRVMAKAPKREIGPASARTQTSTSQDAI